MRKTVAAAAVLAVGMGVSIGCFASHDDEGTKEIKRKPTIPKVEVPKAEAKKQGLPTAAPRADDESPKETKPTIKKIPAKP